MGLGNFQSLNYQSPGAGSVIKYYGSPESGKANAILEVNPHFPR
jgi:hypothetical protein